MNEPKIFGYEFEAIRKAQQGDMSGLRKQAPYDAMKHKQAIEADVAKFHISVAETVRVAYDIKLPSRYVYDSVTGTHEWEGASREQV